MRLDGRLMTAGAGAASISWRLRAPSALTVALLSLVGATAPGIEEAFGVGSGMLAVIFVAQTLGALLGAAATGALHHPLMRGRPAALICAAMLALAGVAPSFALLTLAMLGAGVACFFINTRAQADVASLAGSNRGEALSRFHVWGGAGGFAFPLLVAGALALGMPWRAGFFILAGLFAAYGALAVRSLEMPHPKRNSGRARVDRRAWLAIACGAIAVAIQVTIPLYLATLLVSDYGASEAAGSAAVSVYSFGLLSSRASGTWLLPRTGLDRQLRVVVAIALAGYGLFALAGSAGLVVAGALVIAVGIGQTFPLSMARSIELIGDDRYASSLAFSLNSTAQMVMPATVALWLLFTGLREALVGTAAFAAVMAVSAALSEPRHVRAGA
jgi:MFS family permease